MSASTSVHTSTPAPTVTDATWMASSLEAAGLAALLPAELALDREGAVARIRDVLQYLGAPADVLTAWEDSTFLYYKRRGIIAAPTGTTSNASYGRRHILQGAAARLGGALRLLPLREAELAWPLRSDTELLEFLLKYAEAARTLARPRPLPGIVRADQGDQHAVGDDTTATVRDGVTVVLPDGAMLVLPLGHTALTDRAARHRLWESLAEALAGRAQRQGECAPPHCQVA